jgi:hypothetical protein
MLLTSLLFALGAVALPTLGTAGKPTLSYGPLPTLHTTAVPSLGGPPVKRQIYPDAAQFGYWYDNDCSGEATGNSVPDGYCYPFPSTEFLSLDISLLQGDCISKT